MRGAAALLAVLVLVNTAGAAASDARVDAKLLLDLDLLAETDPARHRDQGPAERMRMLELLRMLESPAAAAPARESSPATTPPVQRGVK
jgi:hypothetical protein